MKRILTTFLILLFVSPTFLAQAKDKEPSEIIQMLLAKGVVEKTSLKSREGLVRIYQEHPDGVWSNRAASDLIKWLPSVADEGLMPQWYHLDKIRDFTKKNSVEEHAALDVLLSEAMLTLASNLAYGINITLNQKYDWYKEGPMAPRLPEVIKAIQSKNPSDFLNSLIPHKDVRYAQLKKALQRYEKIAGKNRWTLITKGDKLAEGDQDLRVRLLKKRLIAEGYLEDKDEKEPSLFTERLTNALKNFQRDNSLEPDGVAGAQTVETLNIPAERKIAQIRVSLDRLRDLLPSLPDHYLLVNIPAFRLWVYEGNNDVLSMKVVAGRRDRKTPLMVDEMQYLVFSPAWYVPNSIAIKDKLPEIVKDVTFIERNNLVLTKKGEDGGVHVVDANTVDWSEVTAENFDYQLTQKPGNGNALGKVKFIFPNEDNIYLHDTSQPELFEKDIRSYSSGCVRIEEPLDLALYLLQSFDEWDKRSIQQAMNDGNQKVVVLKKRLPVILTYLTAWGNKDGSVSFGSDIYGYDQRIISLFNSTKIK